MSMGIVYNGVKLPDLGSRAFERLVLLGSLKPESQRSDKERAAIAFVAAQDEWNKRNA